MQQAVPPQADAPIDRVIRRPRWHRWLLAAGLVIAAAGIAAIVLLSYEPGFYRAGMAASPPAPAGPPAPAIPPARAEQLARRMVSKVSALHAAVGRRGPWEAAITDDEVNAWLAVDLPRNHRGLLPRGFNEPRVAFLPHHVRVAARTGLGPFSAVAWIDLEVRLRGVNQVGLVLAEARLGAVPLPRGAIIREVANRLAAAGLVTDLRRLDDRMLLVVAVPSTYDAAAGRSWLKSLAINEGEVLVAGVTGQATTGVDNE